MRVNTNTSSMVVQEINGTNTIATRSSLEKLSSGFQINKASDDASGLAIADKLRTQKSSLQQSVANANSALSLVQIADKAMAEQSNILDLVKVKLTQAATDTTSSEGRKAIAKDINKLLTQLDNIASQTNYNGTNLLQESASSKNARTSLEFQIGEYSGDNISTNGTIRANTQGLGGGANYSLNDVKIATSGDGSSLSYTFSNDFLETIDESITDLNTMRSNFGSTQNQLESSLRNIMTTETNIAIAESVVRDVDYASESANFTKHSLMGQAISYAHTQANAVPQSVLKLLQ